MQTKPFSEIIKENWYVLSSFPHSFYTIPQIELCVRKLFDHLKLWIFPLRISHPFHPKIDPDKSKNFRPIHWENIEKHVLYCWALHRIATMYLPLLSVRFGIKFSGGKTNAFLRVEKMCLHFSALWRNFLEN